MSSSQPLAATPIAAPRRQLTLYDSTSIIVGIIIGSSIYESSPDIASCVPGPVALIALWVVGGLLSLVGALCYAELATTYPQAGGDYVYLTRAFGRPLGFLFAWAQLWIVRPGSVGVMAFVFARYANELLPLKHSASLPIYATASVILLTLINLRGVRQGKWTQNILTTAKLLGLLAIVFAGLLCSSPPAPATRPATAPAQTWDLYLALILIFYAYGGWNEMAYVAAEVRNPQRNILRSLLLGTIAVTFIYLLINLAFLHALGFSAAVRSKAIAADVLRLATGPWGSRAISLIICITALGAINGLIFTGARITYAMANEHRLFAPLGRWSSRRDTPARSLLIQAGITLALIIAFGRTEAAFKALVNFTTPVFWIFFLLVGLSLFVLRVREPDTLRPYRVPAYPLIPALFCLSSLFMLYASFSWANKHRSSEAFWSIVILAIGLPLALYDRRPRPADLRPLYPPRSSPYPGPDSDIS